jgi:hypothetical protein
LGAGGGWQAEQSGGGSEHTLLNTCVVSESKFNGSKTHTSLAPSASP